MTYIHIHTCTKVPCMIPLCSMPCIKYNLYAYYIQCTGIITLFDTCIHGIHTIHIYILHTYYIYYEQDPKKVQRKYSSNEGTEKSPAHFWALHRTTLQ